MKIFAILIGLMVILLTPSIVLAASPPELDQQQAVRWENTSPWSRPYLARIWNVPRKIAERYGAQYIMPTNGLAGISATSNSVTAFNTIVTRWELADKNYEVFIPIPYDIPRVDTSGIIHEIDYIYPPGLDKQQGIRWGQALPSARFYLARLFGISVEEAARYGAR